MSTRAVTTISRANRIESTEDTISTVLFEPSRPQLDFALFCLLLCLAFSSADSLPLSSPIATSPPLPLKHPAYTRLDWVPTESNHAKKR